MEGDDKQRGAWEVASAGTYVDVRLPSAFAVAFLVVALIAVALPSVGMLWARTVSTTENRELAEAPVFFEPDGAFNWNILADAGAYFDDHFAYRNNLVTANAHLRALFGVSATDQVVVGTDEWLYYGGTLPDYLGQSELSERTLRNIAHNLSQAQAYSQAHGATFVFAVAPNKNTLYPEYMPTYYVRAPWQGNAALLKPLLEEYGVNYVDLFEVFAKAEEGRYLKRDTHWDNRGALMATQAMLEAAGHEFLDLEEGAASGRDDFVGDLESMLFPTDMDAEENWYFEGYNDGEGMTGSLWRYVEGGDVTDSFVRTESSQGTGSLVMYRDSFGNALLPLWAAAYERATFSKLVPYNLPTALQDGVDAVIVERAERHLDFLATTPPIMPSPASSVHDGWPTEEDPAGVATTLEVSTDGPYWKISGMLADGVAEPVTEIYLAIIPEEGREMTVEPAWMTVVDEQGTVSEYGFQAYLAQGGIDLSGSTIRVYVVTDGSARCLKSFEDIG